MDVHTIEKAKQQWQSAADMMPQLICLLNGKGPKYAVECGAAHGALAMTTPGDTTMATLAEVEKVMQGGTARVDR